MLYSQIYGYVWNRHRRFITIYKNNIGITKHENTYDFLVQVRNLLLHLSLRFRHKEERHNLSILTSSSAPMACGARSAQIRLASARPESRPFFVRGKNSTNWLSSKSPKSSARASGAWRHSYPQVTIFYLGFLFWHLWTTNPPCTRVNTCAQVCT